MKINIPYLASITYYGVSNIESTNNWEIFKGDTI